MLFLKLIECCYQPIVTVIQKDIVLGRKITVDSCFANPGSNGDIFHAGSIKPFTTEQVDSSLFNSPSGQLFFLFSCSTHDKLQKKLERSRVYMKTTTGQQKSQDINEKLWHSALN